MDLKGAAPGGSAAVPEHVLAERFEFLRTTWLEVAADVAPGSEQLADLLSRRLDQLAPLGVAKEFDLLTIAEDAAQVSLQVTDADNARTLSKRLRRTVYEYLLAVDAVAATAAAKPAPVVSLAPSPSRRGAVMIGLEEVAAQPWPQAVRPTVIAGALSGAVDGPPDAAGDTHADAADDARAEAMAETANMGGPEGGEEGAVDAVDAEPERPATPVDAHDVPETPAALLPPVTDPAAGAETTATAEPGFAVEPGGTGPGEMEPEPKPDVEPEAEPDLAPAAQLESDGQLPAAPPPEPPVVTDARPKGDVRVVPRPQLTVVAGPARRSAPVPPPAAAVDSEALRVPGAFRRVVGPPPPSPVVIPSYRAWEEVIAEAGADTVELVAPPPAALLPSPPTKALGPQEAASRRGPRALRPPIVEAPVDARVGWDAARSWPDSALHPAEPGTDHAGGWSVRKSPRQQVLSQRMAERRKQAAVQAAVEAAGEPDKGRRRRGDREPLNRDAVPLQVEELLHRKKGADAAVLLQRAAQELGGHDLADLAVDAGDQLKGLGQTRPAINCYLAAWRADPLYEEPLWRLADTSLSDHSTELAVGYLERIADLMRVRGDDDGAVAVYRRITAIAPERKDIRELLRHLHATGRLLD